MKEKHRGQREKSVGLNLVLNVVKTIVSMCFPLITYPYITRVFSVGDIGKINYYLSVISYFQLAAFMGIPTYAVSVGSGKRENKAEFPQFTNEIYKISIFAAIVSCMALGVMVASFPDFRRDWLIWVMLASTVVFPVIGAEWLLQIYEDYFFMTVRYILLQIFGLILLFALIRDGKGIFLYFLIYSAPVILTALLNRFYGRKYGILRVSRRVTGLHHIKVLLPILLANIATVIYVNSDITMLGILCGEESVGIYSTATKIYGVVKNIFTAMTAVFIPRLSLLLQKGDTGLYRKRVGKLIGGLTILIAASTVGLIGLSEDIISLFAGAGYRESARALQILSPAIIFAVLNGINTTVVLIPLKQEKTVLTASFISAAVNIILNLFLLPVYGGNGAALTTLISEFILFAITVRVSRSYGIYKGLSFRYAVRLLLTVTMTAAVILIAKYCVSSPAGRCAIAAGTGMAGFLAAARITKVKIKEDL